MPGSTTEITWGVATRGLKLGLRAEGTQIDLYLRNVGDTTLMVASHVLANKTQLDWVTLHITAATGPTRSIRLLEDRDESGLITAQIQPGAWLRHSINLPRWAARAINGIKPLTAGEYQVWATYTVPESERDNTALWIGHLEAGPVAYSIPAEQERSIGG
jgi:hypothetical protein